MENVEMQEEITWIRDKTRKIEVIQLNHGAIGQHRFNFQDNLHRRCHCHFKIFNIFTISDADKHFKNCI